MPEFNKNFNFNSLYVCLLLLLYNILRDNYSYIIIVYNKLYLFNYYSMLILINIFGLYFILNKLSFDLNIKCAINLK
jgi:hypothetical protein